MELKQISKQLKYYGINGHGNLSSLSRILNISRPTLIHIRDNRHIPNYATYKILSDYFEKLDQLQAKVRNNDK